MFRGEIMPNIGFVIVADDWLVETKAMRRIHNRISKRAGKAAMLLHWRKYIPMHFQRSNRSRYDHEERTKKYKAQKRKKFRSITDLVKTGRTKDYMLTVIPTIRASGKADMNMTITMKLRRPYRVGNNPNAHKQVTVEQQNKEIAAWVSEEEREVLMHYRDIYTAEFREETKRRPKIRKRFDQHLQ